MNWNHFSFYYTDHIQVPLTENHRFPMEKYRMLREKLIMDKVIQPEQLIKASFAKEEDILRAHTKNYLNALNTNTISEKELRPIGLTWSKQLLERSYASVGGFIDATESALENGFSALLAGGTHHAHSDRGEGYCIFNDFAVSALKMLELKKVKKILIIDLDVHQGNGNSSILGNRSDVFILSLHGEKNYPFRKVPSHLDVPLPEKTGDEEYLNSLIDSLKKIPKDFDIIFYQGGVDILKEDKLGTFDLSMNGVMERDKIVFDFSKNKPLALAIGGGYANPIELSVEAYANTFKVAKKFYSSLT